MIFQSLLFFKNVTVVTGSSQGEPGSHTMRKHALWNFVWGTRFLPPGNRFLHEKLVFFVKFALGTRFLPRSNRFLRHRIFSSLEITPGTRFLTGGNRFLRLKIVLFENLHWEPGSSQGVTGSSDT